MTQTDKYKARRPGLIKIFQSKACKKHTFLSQSLGSSCEELSDTDDKKKIKSLKNRVNFKKNKKLDDKRIDLASTTNMGGEVEIIPNLSSLFEEVAKTPRQQFRGMNVTKLDSLRSSKDPNHV